MLRLVRLCALTTLLGALWAQPASAARILGLPETMTTPHFQLHYTGQPGSPSPVTHQQAGDLAGNLERAYSTIVSDWGYPAPLSDGDNWIDVYITDLAAFEASGLAFPDTGSAQTSGYIHIDDGAMNFPSVAMHELFHLVQYGIWSHMDPYVLEASAEWAGFRFIGFPLAVDFGGTSPVPLLETVGLPDMSLTCNGDSCGSTDYEAMGYSRWHFFEYLTERFGNSTVNDLFQRGKTVNDPGVLAGDLLAQTLAAKGATLGDVFHDWTVANMTGTYTAIGLKGIKPPAYSTTQTGNSSGTLATQKIPVNHLAARYVAFKRGTGTSDGPCYAATLNLTVDVPAGLGARPMFKWTAAGSPAIPLALSGMNASLSVPWDTCAWSDAGLVSLPNPSTNVDAAVFTVSGSITVDKKTLATSTPPPAGTYTGPTVPSLTGDEPPSIAVYGPETLRVSKKRRVIRLVVFASGTGKLDARLGSSSLGMRVLRTGNNDLRFTLPKSVTRSLAAASRLTFTSVAANGARGATVTRKLVLTK
jgi:hypothetical protein